MVAQRRGECSEEVGRGRKKGREGAKRKRDGDDDNQDKGCKIRKWKSTPKKDRHLTYRHTHLWHKNLDHHMTLLQTMRLYKHGKKGSKSKVKKVGSGLFWNQFGKHQKWGQGTTPAPTSHARKQLYPLKG